MWKQWDPNFIQYFIQSPYVMQEVFTYHRIIAKGLKASYNHFPMHYNQLTYHLQMLESM